MVQRLAHPYVLLLLTALIWGANAVAGKLAIGHISPMTLTLLRWVGAVVVLFPFARPHLAREARTLRRYAPYFVGLGLLGFTCFNALFYVALMHTSAINAMIIQASMPLVVFVGMFLAFHVRVTGLQVVGFGLTLAGVLLVASHGAPETILSLDLNRGDALIALAVLIFGIYTILLSRKPRVHWLSSIFLLSLGGVIGAVPLMAWELWSGGFAAPDAQGLAVLAFTIVFPSILSQAFYLRGVEAIGANRANIFVNTVPVFGAILAILVLREPFHLHHLAALALVLGGVALAERGRSPVAKPA
ncbi:DMT family transporter [Aureimonas flava]|uniref:DMT family transporter n=1 Tax=Aureimonas flava TaxID=2320271 RepID=A0A3A1WIT6_9HYPH|nr:DMT family transporter [Aureimonas flava]RIX98733.1 DMT family transporter [Aureimonas flava]